MGWTGYHATHYKPDGSIDRKASLDYELFTRWEGHENAHKLLKSSMVGTTYYAAAQNSKGQIYGLVVLTSMDNNDYFNLRYKDMDETMGPGPDNCPASILKLLSPTDHEWALDWRKRCREKAEQKKSPTALPNLPIGARIRVTYGGQVYDLVKHAPAFQFKRPFWYNPARNTYLPANRIPSNYEVLA